MQLIIKKPSYFYIKETRRLLQYSLTGQRYMKLITDLLLFFFFPIKQALVFFKKKKNFPDLNWKTNFSANCRPITSRTTQKTRSRSQELTWAEKFWRSMPAIRLRCSLRRRFESYSRIFFLAISSSSLDRLGDRFRKLSNPRFELPMRDGFEGR